jgi:hypothetical protein
MHFCERQAAELIGSGVRKADAFDDVTGIDVQVGGAFLVDQILARCFQIGGAAEGREGLPSQRASEEGPCVFC